MLNHASINETVLGKIVADKQLWIAERRTRQPLERFRAGLQPSDRDFVAALRRDSAVFILECKKASPSKGLIRAEFDPARLVCDGVGEPEGERGVFPGVGA